MKSKIVAINNIREFWDENTCGLVPNSGFKNLDVYLTSKTQEDFCSPPHIYKYTYLFSDCVLIHLH